MRKNLFGEIIQESKDFSDIIASELKSQKHNVIIPTVNTDKGFTTDYEGKIPDCGIYVIYKYQQPVYVGYSTHSIRNRIARFIAAVKGTEHEKESHPAGYKYRKMYGENFDYVTFKVCYLDFFSSLPEYISILDVEKELIYDIRPVFNKEIYRSIFVSETTYTSK